MAFGGWVGLGAAFHRLCARTFIRQFRLHMTVGAQLLMVVLLNSIAATVVSDERPAAKPDIPVLEITADTTLDPAKTYGRLVIKASDVTVDVKGAGSHCRPAGESKSFTGIGVKASGVSNVTLKNLTVRGFETGLRVEDGRGWTVQNCDFSDNFDDPSFGWGQLSRRGGVVFVGVSGSTIRNCRGKRNWAGCVLERSDENRLVGNDFSRCSEACLEMWQASRNTIAKNKLDYGNRAKPDEVHARDSCCVLIESGSDGNTFADNSCTHGGDGIFLRALNGWVSTGNRFLRNDCSFSHNHGFECWCPDNYFEGNKANHCSYGFWMGGSDRSVMIDNEASFNGEAERQPLFATSARQGPRRHRLHARVGHAYRPPRQPLRRQQRGRHRPDRRQGE